MIARSVFESFAIVLVALFFGAIMFANPFASVKTFLKYTLWLVILAALITAGMEGFMLIFRRVVTDIQFELGY